MNKKIASLLAVALFAGPLSAHAVTSGCYLVTVDVDDVPAEIIACDLYESEGPTTIDLSDFLPESGLGEGTVGIFDGGVLRNVVSFFENDDGFFLQFFFRTFLPSGPFDLDKQRGDPDGTPAVTAFGTVNQYRVFHDFRAPVPEPGSLALLGLGLVGLGLARRRAK